MGVFCLKRLTALTQQDLRLELQFVANPDHAIHAGLLAVGAMARHFDLWHSVRRRSCLNPRADQKRGYGPEVIVGQLILPRCSGGGCLSDREALHDDPLTRELFGVGTPINPKSGNGCTSHPKQAWRRCVAWCGRLGGTTP